MVTLVPEPKINISENQYPDRKSISSNLS